VSSPYRFDRDQRGGEALPEAFAINRLSRPGQALFIDLKTASTMQPGANRRLVRRFAAVDPKAHLILRWMLSPSCSEGPTLIKSPHGLSAGAPTLPRMG
jgi:hypothetical protein